MKQEILIALKAEYGEKIIPMFDSMFVDSGYRQDFYELVEERIKELENEE